MPELLNKSQVAEYLGCSPSTVDRLRAAKKLPSFKVGDMIRFREEDVKAYIEREIAASSSSKEVASA